MAELRRDAPGAAARAYVERLGREMEMEKEKENEGGRRKKKKKKWNDVGGEEEEKDEEEEEELLEGGRVERGEEVERMWGVGMEDLPRLDGVTDVLAKLQRAAEAARVVERG